MSNRERAIQLLDIIDEERMVYVVRILENLTGFAEIPNAETAEAIVEGDKMLECGTGQRYEGATEDSTEPERIPICFREQSSFPGCRFTKNIR